MVSRLSTYYMYITVVAVDKRSKASGAADAEEGGAATGTVGRDTRRYY